MWRAIAVFVACFVARHVFELGAKVLRALLVETLPRRGCVSR